MEDKDNVLLANIELQAVKQEPPLAQLIVPKTRKKKKEGLQATTIRLSVNDHSALRQLAWRDSQYFNELLLKAVGEYAARRGVKLDCYEE